MVTDLILIILYGLTSLMVTLLPPWTITLDLEKLYPMFAMMTSYNSILPVSEIFAMTNLAIAIFVGMHGFKWIKAAYNAVRGSGA